MRAQTNTQLFNQLQQDGYSKAELTLVVQAFELARRIFSGYYVESGKMQIDHVIGTASILGSLRTPAAVVAAGLIHNAYNTGDFGLAQRGISKAKRRCIQRAVGEEVELYVRGFAALPWNSRAIGNIRASLDQLGSVDRVALLLRLADMLEHHRDLAGHYYHSNAEACRKYIRENGSHMVDIANRLGHPSLAGELAQVFADTAAVVAPPAFHRPGPASRGPTPPRSYRRRIRVVVGYTLARGIDKVRSKLPLRARYRQLIRFLHPASISNETAPEIMHPRATRLPGASTDGIERCSNPRISRFPPAHSYAQTRVQLLRQLERERYAASDLDLVADAYELAMVLFTGLFQPSRKTLIAHLVGTASILASLHARAELVAAGLMHSAYEHGDFGSGTKGITASHREQVRGAVGPRAEEYVARYHIFDWKPETIDAIGERIAGLDPVDREVILMRLANDLEELLDLDPLYRPHGTDQAGRCQTMGQRAVPLARVLGSPPLAAELGRALEDLAAAEIAVELRNRADSSAVVLMVPQSTCRRLSLVVRLPAYSQSDWHNRRSTAR